MSRQFVALTRVAVGGGTVFLTGPVEFSTTVFYAQDADTFAQLLAVTPNATEAELIAAASEYSKLISREEFEAALPVASRAAVMAAITPTEPVLDPQGNVITPGQPGVTFSPPQPETPEMLAAAKLTKIAALHKWWDGHPGVLVGTTLPDPVFVFLPIDRDYVALNGVAAILALQNNTGCSLSLGGTSDLSVTIPATAVGPALLQFQTAYAAIAAQWDDTYRAIEAAMSMAELNAVQMPGPPTMSFVA
jgi:hypothetical protein